MTHVAQSETRPNRLPRFLLGAVDLIIAAFVFVLPFIMGGREAWGHWFLISAALLLGVAWAVYATVCGSRYFISWLELFLLAGLGIVWFQVQPQSLETMTQFSDEYERLLPTWSSTQPAGTPEFWSTLSFTPTETRHGIWMFVAYAVFLTVLFQRVRDVADCARLLKWIAASGVLMTAFGLLQWGTSNGLFFWFYEHPFTDPTDHLKGAFSNRNHFAQYLALSLGPLLWWLFRDVKQLMSGSERASAPVASRSRKSGKSKPGKSKSRRRVSTDTPRQFGLSLQNSDRFLSLPIIGLVFCIAIVGLAVLMSLSRGGMIAASAAAVVALIGLWRGFNLGGAMAGILLGGGVLFLSLLAFADQEQVQSRVDQLISTDADQLDAGGPRRAIWAADAKAIQRFPIMGTGVGSHRDVYTTYMDNYADFATSEMTHAESSYVHLALEAGFVGAGLLVLALLCFLARLLHGYLRSESDVSRSLAVAVAASAAAGTLHAVTDFIWYVPAIVVISLVLVVVGLKSASRDFGTAAASRGIWFPRIAWAAAGGFCLLGLIHVQPELHARIEGEQHWYASLRTKLNVDYDETDGFADLKTGEAMTLEDEPQRLDPEAEAAEKAEATARAKAAQIKHHYERIGHLTKSLKACPDQHRVQLALAEQLLGLFDLLQDRSENPLPLNMVRDAAIASGFDSAADLREWMQRACGRQTALVLLADKLARQSLAGCPVQGHAYLSLVETGFIRDPQDALHHDLVDQALLVRGNDPRVTFVAGREALMGGDRDAALAMWDSVFHSNQYFRLNILSILAPQAPVEFFIQQFHPKLAELKDLRDVYQALNRPRDYEVVLNELCRVIPEEAPLIEDEDERLEEMLLACNAARYLKNPELAVQLLQKTVTDFPTAYEAHFGLGVTLYELERHEEAIKHLHWCHEWDPGNEWVPKMIGWARRKLLEDPEDSPHRLTQLQEIAIRMSQ